MQIISLVFALPLAATGTAQTVRGPNGNCGFPNGPDCQSLGRQNGGLEQFTDGADSPGAGCCLLPFRCGNGDGGERCERVDAAAAQPQQGGQQGGQQGDQQGGQQRGQQRGQRRK